MRGFKRAPLPPQRKPTSLPTASADSTAVLSSPRETPTRSRYQFDRSPPSRPPSRRAGCGCNPESRRNVAVPHLPFVPVTNLWEPALNTLGISLNGLRDLTTPACEVFSERYPDNPAVSYFSSAGSGRSGFPQTCAAFLLFHQYILGSTGQANDGMVPVASAQ